MARCTGWLMIVLAAGLLTGCDDEPGGPADLIGSGNTSLNKAQAIALTERDFAAMNETVEAFVHALAAGDQQAAMRYFPSRATFAEIFEVPEEELETAYASRRKLMAQSIASTAEQVRGSTYKGHTYDIEHPASIYPEGATLHDLPVRGRVLTMNDLHVTVASEGTQREITLPLLIFWDSKWYVGMPVQEDQG